MLADKFKAQGKPANVIDKIVESGLKTFYKEVCLLEQAYHPRCQARAWRRRSRKPKARSALRSRSTGFVRYALGEGIEKQEAGDFAAEVAVAVDGQATWSRVFTKANGASAEPPRTFRRAATLGIGGRSESPMAEPALSARRRQGLRRGARRRRKASASISRPSTASPPTSSAAHALGVTLGVVVGGGNILRGVAGRRARACRARPATPWACWRP